MKGSTGELQPRSRLELPLLRPTEKIERFMRNSVMSGEWEKLSRGTKRIVCSLGTKLEPILQIAPVVPQPVVLGFECLALGVLGESFPELLEECADFDPGALRICLSIAAVETINTLRIDTGADIQGVSDLKFTLNLDSHMLDCPLLGQFLRQYCLTLQHNVIFEIHEETTQKYATQLKNLQVDFNLRFAADDLNAWNPEVRQQLIPRVEMTKMDCKSFTRAMKHRGEQPPAETVRALSANAVPGKPLVLEGVSNLDYLDFLKRHWDHRQYGDLYGQGYQLEPGMYWDRVVLSLKTYGLPGGNVLRLKHNTSPLKAVG